MENYNAEKVFSLIMSKDESHWDLYYNMIHEDKSLPKKMWKYFLKWLNEDPTGKERYNDEGEVETIFRDLPFGYEFVIEKSIMIESHYFFMLDSKTEYTDYLSTRFNSFKEKAYRRFRRKTYYKLKNLFFNIK